VSVLALCSAPVCFLQRLETLFDFLPRWNADVYDTHYWIVEEHCVGRGVQCLQRKRRELKFPWYCYGTRRPIHPASLSHLLPAGADTSAVIPVQWSRYSKHHVWLALGVERRELRFTGWLSGRTTQA